MLNEREKMKVEYADTATSRFDISNKVYDPPAGAVQSAWGVRLPGQGLDGYGSKITTEYKIRYEGRMHRIYATCHSNVASEWIVKGGKKLFLR